MIDEKEYVQFKNLNDLDVINLFTKKPFNFSRVTNTPDNIKRDLESICKLVNYQMQFKKGVQTHSANIKIVTEENINEEFIDTDGLITNLKGVALCTIVADCQAILLYDKTNKVIANIHSGWKGTLNKILRKAISLMVKNFNTDVKDLVVCICPSILKCCFEVDEDVVQMFKNNFNNIDQCISLGSIKDGKQKYFIDTVKINLLELKSLGVLEENITNANICTKCNASIYHSYRVDYENSGRNLALICLK